MSSEEKYGSGTLMQRRRYKETISSIHLFVSLACYYVEQLDTKHSNNSLTLWDVLLYLQLTSHTTM